MTEPGLRRRESDGRIDRIEDKLDLIIEKLEDPKASAVGRILLERADRNEEAIRDLRRDVDELESDRDQAKGGLAFLRYGQIIFAILLAALSIYVALRNGLG